MAAGTIVRVVFICVCFIQFDIAVLTYEVGSNHAFKLGFCNDESVYCLADTELGLGQSKLGVIEVCQSAAAYRIRLLRDVIGLLGSAHSNLRG